MQDDSAAPVAASQEPAADTVMFAVERYVPPRDGMKPAAWMVVSWQLAEPYSHMRVLLDYVEDTGIGGEYRLIAHTKHGLVVAHYTAKPRTEWEIEGYTPEPPASGAAES
jgi:hypothetical protein